MMIICSLEYSNSAKYIYKYFLTFLSNSLTGCHKKWQIKNMKTSLVAPSWSQIKTTLYHKT